MGNDTGSNGGAAATLEPAAFDVPHRLKVITCGRCGVVFAVPIETHAQREREGGQLYCPNGDAISFAVPETAVTMDKKELKRRAQMLASRGERAEYGRVICYFCGKKMAEYQLKRHLKDRHSEELRELPAALFDRQRR